MRKWKYITIVVVVVVLISALVYGMNTKKGWIDDTQIREYMFDSEYKMDVSGDDLNNMFLSPEKIGNFKGLYDSADVIVKVKVSSENNRNFYTDCAVTQVDMLECYKGNVRTNRISIIEPIKRVEGEDYKNIDTIEGYVPMEDNEEYIVFLTQEPTRMYGGIDIYIPTSTSLSKYKYDTVTNSIKGEALLSADIYNGSVTMKTYIDIKMYDMITDDENLLRFYKDNVSEINTLLNKG